MFSRYLFVLLVIGRVPYRKSLRSSNHSPDRPRAAGALLDTFHPTTAEAWTCTLHTMTRDSRHGSLWRGLACLLAVQLPFVSAQVADIEKATNASLLWGPYRPNLYFGVRPRIPKSLMGGLMWTRVEDYSSVQNSEFPCIKRIHVEPLIGVLTTSVSIAPVADLNSLQTYL